MRSRRCRSGYGSSSCWLALLGTVSLTFSGEVDVAGGGLVMIGDGWMVAVF